MLDAQEAALEKALLAARRQDVAKLLREETAFGQFAEALGKIGGSDDPRVYLRSAKAEAGSYIRDIHIIEVKGWQAFYYVDAVEKLCVGLLVCRKDAYFDDKLQMIADAARRHS